MMVHISNPSAWEAEAGVRGLLGLQSDTVFQKETKGGRMKGKKGKPEGPQL